MHLAVYLHNTHTAVQLVRISAVVQMEECEHLRQIIKELSQSRAKVQKTMVDLEEQYSALQKEYFRCALRSCSMLGFGACALVT